MRPASELVAPDPRVVRRRWWMAGVSAALIGAAGLVLVVHARRPTQRPRGGPQFAVLAHRAGSEGAVPLASGDHLGNQDTVSVSLESSGKRYVLVVAQDATGAVHPIVPPEGDQSAPMPAGHLDPTAPLLLPSAPGPLRIDALSSNNVLRLEDIAPRLRALAQADPAGLRSTTALNHPSAIDRTVWVERDP